MHVSIIINEYIEKALQLPFIISDNIIQDEEGEGACLRYDPAPAAEERYIDGSRLVTWNLTYFIRCKEMQRAQDLAYKITNALDGKTLQDDKTHRPIEIKALTLPQYMDKDEKGFTTYSAAISCTYMEE